MSRGSPGPAALFPRASSGSHPVLYLCTHLQTKTHNPSSRCSPWPPRTGRGWRPRRWDKAWGAGTRQPGAIASARSSACLELKRVASAPPGVPSARAPRSPPRPPPPIGCRRGAGLLPRPLRATPPPGATARCSQLPGAPPRASRKGWNIFTANIQPF